MITKSRPFSRKVDIKKDMSDKRFFQKNTNDISHVIAKNRGFSRKSDIK